MVPDMSVPQTQRDPTRVTKSPRHPRVRRERAAEGAFPGVRSNRHGAPLIQIVDQRVCRPLEQPIALDQIFRIQVAETSRTGFLPTDQ